MVRPFQSASTLSSRPGFGRASRNAKSFAREAARLGFLFRRSARRDAAQHRPAFPVAAARHIVGGLEARRGVAQRGVDLLFAPDVEQAFLAVLIGVEGGGEGVADPHLAHQPPDRLTRPLGEGRIGPQGMNKREQFEDLRVVVEHLLEMRHEPFGVGRIARIAAAEMIVDAARVHRLEHGAHRLAEGRIAAAEHLVPEEAEDRRVGEFRRAAQAAMDGIDRAYQRIADAVEIGGRDARARVQFGELRQMVGEGRGRGSPSRRAACAMRNRPIGEPAGTTGRP